MGPSCWSMLVLRRLVVWSGLSFGPNFPGAGGKDGQGDSTGAVEVKEVTKPLLLGRRGRPSHLLDSMMGHDSHWP